MEPKFLKRNSIFDLLERHGYGVADLLPAFPGCSESAVVQRLEDNGLQNRRTVWRMGHLGIRPCRTKFFNIAAEGNRQLGEGLMVPRGMDHVVHCYGGSTTLCSNVADGETWPSYLQQFLLGRPKMGNIQVVNWGAGNLTTLQASTRLLVNCMEGRVPSTAIFYGGSNDCFYSWGDVDGVVAFLDRCLEASQHHPGVATPVGELARLIPSRDLNDPLRRPRPLPSMSEVREALLRIRQARTVARQIQAACTENWGVNVLRFWEPTPFAFVRSDQDLVPRIRQSNHRITLTQEVHRALAADALGASLEEEVVDLSDIGQDRLAGPLWIDEMHASPLLNSVVAEAILPVLERKLTARLPRVWFRSSKRQRQSRRNVAPLAKSPDSDANLYPLW
jgi:lysophospholipase L1-like esterase